MSQPECPAARPDERPPSPAAAPHDHACRLHADGRVIAAGRHWPELADHEHVDRIVEAADRTAVQGALKRAVETGAARTEARLSGGDMHLLWTFVTRPDGSVDVALSPTDPSVPVGHAISHQAAAGIALCDRDGRIRFCNQAYGRIYGWPRARLLGRLFTDMLCPADRRLALAHHRHVLSHGARPESVEYEVYRRDGEQRIVDVQEAVVRLPDDAYRLATVVDVTDHRRNERNLADTEARLRDLMDAVPGAVFQFRYAPETGYSLTHISEGMRTLAGLEAEVDLHDFDNWLAWIPEEERDAYLQSIEISRQRVTPWSHEWPIDVPAGRIWLHGASRPHAYEDGSILWNGLVFDITARKQAENRLDRAETDYAHVFDHTREGLYRSTPDGRLLDVNWPLVRMQRCQSKAELLDAITDIARDWYVDPAVRDRIRERLDRDGHVEEFEGEAYRVGTGETFWSSENARAVRAADGELLYYQGSVRDVTDQRRAERFGKRRGEILEMVARGEPLTLIVYEIVGTLEAYQNRLTATVCQLHDGMLAVEAAPALSNACIHAIHGHTPEEVGAAVLPAMREGRAVLESDPNDERAGAGGLRGAMQASGYGHVMALPVLDQEGAVFGVLAVFAAKCDDIDEDVRSMLHELAQITSIAFDQHRLMAQLVERAQYDPLTRLPNRTLLGDRLHQLTLDADRKGRSVAVLLLDLDEFKLINDTLGHGAGDQLLTEVAARLRECVRAADTVARFGGDEFVVVVPLNRADAATDVAERIVSSLRPRFRLRDRDVSALPSIGISLYPRDGTTPDNLIQAADTAMYSAKHAGKNQYRYFADSMNARVSQRLQIETQLREALEARQLVLEYQPRVRLPRGALYGAEALVRWQHPDRGRLLPGEFLGVAEQSALIAEIDRYVVETAMVQLAAWQRAGHALTLSMNLSGRTLNSEAFGGDIAAIIERTGVDTAGIELEITESMVMQDFDHSARQLHDLKRRAPGLLVALDDFGSGHSSLNYLRSLPIDTLKIDRSFIADLDNVDTADTGRAIAKTIVELGQNLGMAVIAEGVETPEQVDVLRLIDCHAAQGYCFAEPLEPGAFLQRLEADAPVGSAGE